MSLGIVIKGPEGLVLAAESRITLTAQIADKKTIAVNFDNATKLLSFSDPNCAVGVVTYGLAALGLRPAHSFIPEFEKKLKEENEGRLSVKTFADKLSVFFMDQWKSEMPEDYNGPSMTFVVAGYDEGAAYGSIYLIEKPQEQHVNDGSFGITWGGQREFVDRLLRGYDGRLKEFLISQDIEIEGLDDFLFNLQMKIPLEAMPLQDCVDLAIFFVRTTIDAQNLTLGIRGCGGHIDVATITRNGLDFVQRKEIVGEDKSKR